MASGKPICCDEGARSPPGLLSYKGGVARFDVRVMGLPQRDPGFFDARSVVLRVERDGTAFQLFAVVVTGDDRLLKHPRLVSCSDFWPAAVMAACEELRVQIHALGVLRGDPEQAVNLLADYSRIEQLLGSAQSLPSLATDTIVASWTA
jgi:hypothetical protein